MTSAWLLGTVSLMTTTIAALLIFLYLYRAPRLADAWKTPEGQRAYLKHTRRVTTGVGLLAAWLVVQGVALILI